ncbi:MAG: LLM class F420-dependent oxidoreductase [Actinomycetota bacterium]|jgi:probable F420-dependent oxidoreductase|nr:LLM class F420-dependent oxidoreductase [Actinomycetota bacterium]
MDVGVTPINSATYLDPTYLRDFVQLIEGLGYESVWTFEHVIVPHEYESRYPYSPTGKLSVPADSGFTDPLVALTYVAAATERLRLGTGVNILTQTNALYLAKQASSLDHLSNGRFMLGVGVGWLEEEFYALGVPFDRRGARADEYIDAMRACWSGDDVSHTGDFLDWQGFKMLPTPAQQPSLPVFIGGTTDAAIRRVVARGDGWYVIHKDLDDFRGHIERLHAECDRQGRDPAELELTAYWNYHREGLAGLEVYRDHGVSRVLVNTAALKMGKPHDAVTQFATEALPAT